MNTKIEKKELINRVANRTAKDSKDVEVIVDAMLEEIYESLKREETVSLRNFGSFYINVRRSGTVFKFNPSQRLRAIFGWASTYKGDI